MKTILLFLLCVVVEVNSQTYPFIRYGRDDSPMTTVLSNHSYLDLITVGIDSYERLECHTDLGTCCTSTQGSGRGDWFFPNGSILQFSDSGDSMSIPLEVEVSELTFVVEIMELLMEYVSVPLRPMQSMMKMVERLSMWDCMPVEVRYILYSVLCSIIIAICN